MLDYRFDVWGVQPTEGADFTVANPRTPEVPESRAASVKMASFNVLQLLHLDRSDRANSNDDSYRGADTA